MKLGLYNRIVIHDKNGKLVKRTHWKISKSFVLQFLQHIDFMSTHSYGNQGVSVPIKDVNAASINLWINQGAILYFAVFAGDNDSGYGILVGTGTTAVTNIDYKMETKIAHGVGAGQLDYGAHSRTAAQVVGANVDLIISRTFYNGSGNSITVNEIGIQCQTVGPAGGAYSFLLARDIITPVAVANAQTLTVQYTFRTTA